MTRVRAILVGGVWACLSAFSATAVAQIDLSGTWAALNSSDADEDAPGSNFLPVDYVGMPLNASGRAAALVEADERIYEPARVCALYTPVYLMLGLFAVKITPQSEPLNGGTVAWHVGGWSDMPGMTIWMDGRPRPSAYAPHPVEGFTSGVWEDDVLKAQTTHLLADELRRNGVPSSDRAVMTTWFYRHGEYLTLVARIVDPVYLSEPYVLTRTFHFTNKPDEDSAEPCIPTDHGMSSTGVPHYLPGANPTIDQVTKTYGIPLSAVLGGAETMYPSYRKQLKGYVRPAKCVALSAPRNCGGPGVFFQDYATPFIF